MPFRPHLALIALLAAPTLAQANASKEVAVGTGASCNNGFQWLVVKSKNRNRSIVANVEITQRSGLTPDVYQRQYVVAPGGTTQMLCSGSHGSSAGGAYTATARLLGAEYGN